MRRTDPEGHRHQLNDELEREHCRARRRRVGDRDVVGVDARDRLHADRSVHVMRHKTRVLAAVITALGVATAPALAASFTVGSSNLATFRTCTLTPLSGASTAGTDSWVNQAAASANNGT